MSYLHTQRNRGDAVTIRRARPADATALLQLAALDEAKPLDGDVLVAEVDGELWARARLADGRRISDPFRPTAEARALLELRAEHVERATGGRSLSPPGPPPPARARLTTDEFPLRLAVVEGDDRTTESASRTDHARMAFVEGSSATSPRPSRSSSSTAAS